MKKFNPKKSWESEISKEDIVLDIGCWDGKKVLELSNKCKEIYGIDINKERLKNADKRVKNNLFFGDVTKSIPIKKNFDWIILSEVLEHLEEDDKALENISNSLKKGGKLILSTPRKVPLFEFWDPAWFRWKFLKGERHYHYSEKELKQKLESKGLKIKEIFILGDTK